MPRRVRSLRCPTCKKLVRRSEPEFPFCSQRCRLVDLGKWASGGYVISAPIQEADQYGGADYTVSPPRPSRPDGSPRKEDKRGKRS